jgi:[acyl-carrier-protein] S-malonyltransferase
MSRKLAVFFPGQGSQYVGMGKDLWENSPVARRTFEQAGEALGIDAAALCFDGPEEKLRLTANTQPAILTVSVAAWRALTAEFKAFPLCAAGHSLGEYAALVASGVIQFEDAVRAVRQRGQFMQEAVPEGQGAMAALLGLDPEIVDSLCREDPGPGVVSPANYNAPGQIVISGDADAVERVSKAAQEGGARKVMPLPVSAPFHSPLMIPAGERLRDVLDGLALGDFSFDVISNVDAASYPGPEALVDILIRQVSRPVRWQECVEAALEKGADLVAELGPKKVLSGLMKRINPRVEVAQAEDTKGLRRLLEILL